MPGGRCDRPGHVRCGLSFSVPAHDRDRSVFVHETSGLAGLGPFLEPFAKASPALSRSTRTWRFTHAEPGSCSVPCDGVQGRQIDSAGIADPCRRARFFRIRDRRRNHGDHKCDAGARAKTSKPWPAKRRWSSREARPAENSSRPRFGMPSFRPRTTNTDRISRWSRWRSTARSRTR